MLIALSMFFVSCEEGATKSSKLEAVDLGLSVKWANLNIGAKMPEAYGHYFAWGETLAKENYGDNNYDVNPDKYTFLGKEVLDLEDDAAHMILGEPWRIPTKDEFKELIDKCSWEKTHQDGVFGFKISGPNGNSIFLPAAGEKTGKKLYYDGSQGLYWSSTVSSTKGCAVDVYFDSGASKANLFWYYRVCGLPIRPVCK